MVAGKYILNCNKYICNCLLHLEFNTIYVKDKWWLCSENEILFLWKGPLKS